MVFTKSTLIITLSLLAAAPLAAQKPSLTEFYKQCRGAAVLPYFLDKGGKKTFILTRESSGPDKGTFDGFSGGKETGENHPKITAGREFYEESMGLFPKAFKQRAWDYIDLKNNTTKCIMVNTSKKAVTYFTEIDFNDAHYFRKHFYSKRSHLIANGAPFHLREKDQCAFVYADNLSNAIAHAKRNSKGHFSNITVTAKLYTQDRLGHTVSSITKITLRPCLVSITQPYFQQAVYTKGKSPLIRFYA